MAAKGGGKVVGTATVNVIFTPDQESLEQVAAAAQQAAGGGGDATPASERPRKGRAAPGVAANATATETNVKAKVNKTVAKDIQDQLNAHAFEITINTQHLRDQITAALKAPFSINVTASMEGERQAGGAHMATPMVTQARPSVRLDELPDRLKGQLQGFGVSIDNLHQRLTEAHEAIGKTFGRLGGSGTQVDKAIDILEAFGASDFTGLLQMKDTGKLPAVTGGALSQAALEARGIPTEHAQSVEAAGRDFTSIDDKGKFRQSNALAFWKNLGQFIEANPPPAATVEHAQPGGGGQQYDRAWLQRTIKALEDLGTDEYSAAKQRSFSGYDPTKMKVFHDAGKDPDTAEAELVSFRRALSAMGSEPGTEKVADAARPAMEALAAAEKTLKAITRAIPTEPVGPQDFMAKYATDRSIGRNRGVRTQVGEELSGTGIVDEDGITIAGGRAVEEIVVPGKTGRRGRTQRGATPDADPEATARSRAQLGTRRNPRANFGGFEPREINGINVDIQPLLRAAQLNEFSGLVQQQKTGQLHRFRPRDEDEAARARAAGTNPRGFTLDGLGRVQNVKPSDAFWTAVSQAFDEDIAAKLQLDPDVQNLVRASLQAGSDLQAPGDPRHPRAGQGGGESGGIANSTARGFQHAYEAAYRLRDTLGEIKTVSEDIDDRWQAIADAQGSGRQTSRMEAGVRRQEDHLARLEARAKDLAREADLSATPELQAMAGVATPEQKRVLKAASDARSAMERERSFGRYVNTSQRVVGEGIGLTEEQAAKRVRTDPNLIGRAQKELGLEGMQAKILKDVLTKFQDPDFIGQRKNAKGETETFPENSVSAMSRAFREVVADIEIPEGTTPGGRDAKRLTETAIADVRQALLGSRTEVIEGQGDTAYKTEERRGGYFDTVMRRQAEAAADRADSGRGRGRVYRTLGDSATGGSAASGIPERIAEPMRPATALDTERQTLMARYEAEARKVAEQRTAGRDYKALGFESRDEFVRSELMSPPIRRRGGGTIPAQIKGDIRGEVESTTDVGKRVAEIRKIQAAADKMLAGIAEKSGDVNEQRELVGTETVPGGRSSKFRDAVRAEALNVLQTRSAGHARDPYGRETKDPVTGDQTRAAYAKAGGLAAGQPLGGPAPREGAGAWMAKDIASPAGTFHVIIAGQTAPIQVQIAAGGGAGGTGRGGGGRKPPAPPGAPPPPPLGPEVPGGMDVPGSEGNGANRTLFSSTEAFDRQYGRRDPLGTRKRPSMRVKRTAEEIGRERMAREAVAEQKRLAAEEERRNQLTTMGTQPINMVGASGPNQSIKAQRMLERREAAEAKAQAAAANQPFADAAADAKATEAAQRRQELAQRRVEAENRRIRQRARVNDPVGFAREQDVEDQRQRRLRGQLRILNRSVPRRGFTASATDFISSIAPGSGSLERQFEAQDLATREANEIRSESTRRAQTRTTRRGLIGQIRAERAANQTGVPTEREKALTNLYRDQIQAGKASNAIIRESTMRFDKFNAEATKGSTVLKAFGAAAIGASVSTGVGAITVGLGMAVAAPIITGVTEGLQQALGPVLERASGFAGTTGRVQSEVATGFRASNDDIRATLAQTGISARLSNAQLAQISPALGERGTTVAGTQALQTQFDQFNAARSARDQQTHGYDRALTRPTGGLFDIDIPTYLPLGDVSIGGQASTAETLAGQLRTLGGRGDFRTTTKGPLDDLGIGDNFATRQANDAKVNADLLDKNNQQLGFLNQNLKDSKYQLVAGGTGDELAEQQRRLGAVGAESLGEVLKDKGILIQGLGAQEDPRAFLDAYNKGPQLSPEQLLSQDSRAIKAQIQLEDAQRRQQITEINPQTFALAEAQRPLGPAAAGIGISRRDDPAVVKTLNAELAQTQKLYDQINTEVDTGIKAAKSFVSESLGAAPGAEFAASLDKVVDLGHQITQIEVGVQTKQAAYSAHQFAYQIDLAKRSLSDAKGLVSGIGDSMGAIERQIFNLQRQSQALSLGQSQRQINFQVAVAGFQAPGLSSEEAEARQDQAKEEAAYAQKQLDIQKQLFGLQGRQFNRGAARQVRDLTRQLGLLQEGREVSLSTAAAEKKILALTKIQAKENKNVETFYNSAVTRTGDIMSEEAKLVAATGKDMREVGNIVLAEFKRTYEGYWAIVNGGNAPANSSGSPDDRDKHAAGFLGSTNGSTSLGKWGVAGEAAGEAVAIVKNPQQLMSPGNSGGDTFIVNIYNPIVKNDEDKTRLIADVKRAIQKEGALLLPRRA